MKLEAGFQSLDNSSPFIPPNFNPSTKTAPTKTSPKPDATASTLLFRGVYQLGGEWFFNLEDKRSREIVWVGLRSDGSDFYVESYDDEADSIVVRHNQNPLTLELHRPQHSPIPVTTANRAQPTVNTTKTEAKKPVVKRRVVRPSSSTNRSNNPQRPVRRRITRPTGN